MEKNDTKILVHEVLSQKNTPGCIFPDGNGLWVCPKHNSRKLMHTLKALFALESLYHFIFD